MYHVGFNEKNLLIWIQENMRSDFMDIFMKFLTKIGDNGAIWIIFAVVFLAITKHRKMGLRVAFSLVFSALIGNLILKNYVARIRPYDVYTYIELIIEKQNDFSFPSGHTSASIAAAVTIFKSKFMYKKFNLGYLSIILAVLISFSRLYLFVHYPTDILGGIITGLLCAELAFILVERLYKEFEKRKVAD